MKIVRATLLLGLLSSALSAPARAADVPSGSYKLSCSRPAVAGDVLSASCRKLNGAMQATTLPRLASCLNSISHDGDIGNIDGNLICLPDLPKADPHFVFPESETRINQWVYGGDAGAMVRHSWGVWAGLTQPVGLINGLPVRAFETWAVPSNIVARSAIGLQQVPSPSAPLGVPKRDLGIPRQFEHGHQAGKKAALLAAKAAAAPGVPDTGIVVSVAYNPPGANHAIANRLFYESTLQQYMKNGYTDMPNFPNNTVTVKPVFKIIPKNLAGGIYTFPGWPGPGAAQPNAGYDESIWNNCVYIDIRTPVGKGGNSNDPGCKSRSGANTFYLNQFVHSKITADDAVYLSNQLGHTVNAGDYIVLVAMHVTTRENKMWTWQTFWWSANADQPFAPSSNAIAQARPLASLDEATRHYAMAVAYNTVTPAQPITGGENVGEPVFTYNPYLEAGFDPSTFGISRPINGKLNANTGIQTNCMTCHNMAAYVPKGGNQMPYATDFYMSLTDPVFSGSLKSDFSWTIINTLVNTPAK